MTALDTPVSQLKGVGPKIQEKLDKIGIFKLRDLFFHLPLKYQDRTRVVPIRHLQPSDHALVSGIIQKTTVIFHGRRRMECVIDDGTGKLTLSFFHFSQTQRARLQEGARLTAFGEVRFFRKGFSMAHPEYQVMEDDDTPSMAEHLTPIYPTTEGVSQQLWRRLFDQAIQILKTQSVLPALLPEVINNHWIEDITLKDAVLFLHAPTPDTSAELINERQHPMQKRLAFEELLAHHLCLRQAREKVQQHPATPLLSDSKLRDGLLAQLPFALTGAQARVVASIEQDLNRNFPMMRLVQGDVGSGKTVVAALAALQAVEAGKQVALMAPTEILAEQHYQQFLEWCTPLGVDCAWLSGKLPAAKRRDMMERITLGLSRIVIGTHALFQDDVQFQDLALVIIDEQHRFGVQQRLTLQEKSTNTGIHAHQLIMTATPIPRTLAMSVYADLDTSMIDELPPGRQPIDTVAISDTRRDDVIARIRTLCEAGRQVYWVCTLIEESEVLSCQAAEDAAQLLQEALPHLKVALVHGRMISEEKESIMHAFKEGEINVLVATTVIEVGVNVPNASLMVIENPERLGLAQLHQLRGRVGRGHEKSFCILLFHSPLSQQAKARLDILRKSQDGFQIAAKDLELRGPGEVLGVRQTGVVNMRVANLMRDKEMLPEVQKAADTLLQSYPDKVPQLIERWIGISERFQRA